MIVCSSSGLELPPRLPILLLCSRPPTSLILSALSRSALARPLRCCVEDEGDVSLNRSLLSTSFLALGLGGSSSPLLLASSAPLLPLRSLSAPLSSPTTPLSSPTAPPPRSRFTVAPESKIFAKSKPTFGELLNRFDSSFGLGVDTTSPVVVRTTPFIAEGSVSV